jgi:hypothetical protein
MTSLPDLAHGCSRAGPVRERRPVYVDLLPPCNAGCPAGENIQAWLAHAYDIGSGGLDHVVRASLAATIGVEDAGDVAAYLLAAPTWR